MNKHQFHTLNKTVSTLALMAPASVGLMSLLANQEPRTLMFGYTAARESFHVYVDATGIHKVVYDYTGRVLQYKGTCEGMRLSDCVPNKRLYPEACDFEFCALLKAGGIDLSFATWENERVTQQFYGKRLHELTFLAEAA